MDQLKKILGAALKKILGAALALLLLPSLVAADDGISGIASNYGPGDGVAMPFCTWTVRHTQGCGWVRIQSHQTGLVVTVQVVDYCYCIVPESSHPNRIVDLQYGVVAALGLEVSQGLYEVTVWRTEQSITLPNTALDLLPDRDTLTIAGWLLLCLSALILIDRMFVRRRK
jgi:hypothetical protein